MADNDIEELKSMSLGDHLEELRYRLVRSVLAAGVGVVVCLIFGRKLLGIVASPFENAMKLAGLDPQMQAIQLPEQFMVYLKTGIVFGLLFSCPIIFYHIWAFISAGLYRREQKYVYAVAPASALLFVTGAVFFILVVAPMTITFFVSFNTGIEFVKVNITLQSYVNFVLSLTLVFGLAFQMPIAIIFAEKMGIVTIENLIKARRFMILGLLVAAAIITPPDVISQIALAVPLYLLFEGSILVCWLLRRRKR